MATDIDTAANLLYGATAPKPTPAQAHPTSMDEAAERLFGGTSLTRAEVAQGFKDKVIFNPTVPSHLEALRQGGDSTYTLEQNARGSTEVDVENASRVAQDIGQVLKEVTAELQLNDLASEAIGEAARELGFNDKERIAKLVDMYEQHAEAQSNAWQEESLAEFSQDQLQTAAEFVQEWADNELLELLTVSGLGNNRSVIRLALKLADEIR